MKTEQYIRKPFPVDAVQVTAENMAEIATWCEGEVQQTPPTPAPAGESTVVDFIKVNVHHPLSDRQTRAFVGDWVLYAHKGYKVYTDVAFERNFEPVNPKAVSDADMDPNDAALTVVQVEPKQDVTLATAGEVEKAKDVTKAEEPKECGLCGTTWFSGTDVCPNESTHPRSTI